MINEKNVKTLFNYDPQTGRLKWRVSPSAKVRVGDDAGSIKDGYRLIAYKGKRYRAHRIAWLYFYMKRPVGFIDHINGVKSDNRISNLRDVTNAENLQNMRKPMKGNKSGYLGVCNEGSRFRALIMVDGKQERIGVFDTAEEAHSAYVKRKREVHATCSI